MKGKGLYLMPGLLLASLALVLAVIGLSRGTTVVVEHPVTPAETSEMPVEQPAAPRFDYWMATRVLPASATPTQETLVVASSPVPVPGAIPSSTPLDTLHLRKSVRAGELLTEDHLVETSLLARQLPEGFQALALAVDDVVAAGGLLRPGDLVDVIGAFRRSDKERQAALVLLREITVLAVRGELSSGEGQDAESRRRNNTVVLAVPSAKAPALVLAASEGTIRLAVSGFQPSGVLEHTASAEPAKPVYFDDLFPRPPAPPARPRPAPAPRVQVFEGTQTRDVHVR
ncbi:MAG: Flp pilus assembly protein CpaB [Marinobacter sp.]|nr:Flp pilus assembly protein CpaB [Marinobacter sp.]